jgi:hypothetical protein
MFSVLGCPLIVVQGGGGSASLCERHQRSAWHRAAVRAATVRAHCHHSITRCVFTLSARRPRPGEWALVRQPRVSGVCWCARVCSRAVAPAARRRSGVRRRLFLAQAVFDLKRRLQACGSDLAVRSANAAAALRHSPQQHVSCPCLLHTAGTAPPPPAQHHTHVCARARSICACVRRRSGGMRSHTACAASNCACM